jgi:squalene-associated FAD-dependent desaturase
MNASTRRIAVVGAGWAGLAAAVRATQRGAAVTLFEMAGQPGGRARSVPGSALTGAGDLDNGQHILIGAYTRTLALMHTVGAPVDQGLWRQPLTLRYPDGRGLAVTPGPALWGLLRAVAGCRGWTWGDRAALLAACTRWALAGFRCAPALSVHQLCRKLPPPVRELLIDPLCVAALNTPADEASAAVFLRVLRDALFSGPGSADLLLPREPLGALLPAPAAVWLQAQGATLHMGRRVQSLARVGHAWHVDGASFDGVVLAATAAENARLVDGLDREDAASARAWAEQARALRYEPIITVLLHWPGLRLPAAMTALVDGPQAPAQFAFDHGALGATPGRFAFVVSGAQPWVDAGLQATGEAVLQQALACFGTLSPPGAAAPRVVSVLAEKRATFRCTPLLQRPPGHIAPGLWAAGDYVAGPYPATLEGAVIAGEAAAEALTR